jgi:hypothetical protein
VVDQSCHGYASLRDHSKALDAVAAWGRVSLTIATDG